MRAGALLACLVTVGCTAGKYVAFVPANHQYSCEGIDFSASTLSIETDEWLYYVVPLGKMEEDRRRENLQVSFFFRSNEPVELSAEDLHIVDRTTQIEHKPIRLLIGRQFFLNDRYHTDFDAEFDIENDLLEVFELRFAKPVNGCTIPMISYRKQASKHYAQPIN